MDSIDTKQNATPVRVVGNDSTGAETNFVEATAAGGLHNNLRDSAGNELLGRKLPSNSIPVAEAEAPTYSTSIFNLVSAATATDIFTLTGSATKTIKIKRIRISGTRGTHTWTDILLIKRSTANTGGTSTTPAIVSHDSLDAAATAVARAYTANPSALGTLVGNVRAGNLSMPLIAPSNAQSNGPGHVLEWVFGDNGSKPLILRGTTQVAAINLNGATVAGSAFNISIEWTEE